MKTLIGLPRMPERCPTCRDRLRHKPRLESGNQAMLTFQGEVEAWMPPAAMRAWIDRQGLLVVAPIVEAELIILVECAQCGHDLWTAGETAASS